MTNVSVVFAMFSGYTTTVLGVKSVCRLRDLFQIPENVVKVKVITSLPTLQVNTVKKSQKKPPKINSKCESNIYMCKSLYKKNAILEDFLKICSVTIFISHPVVSVMSVGEHITPPGAVVLQYGQQ